MIKRILLLLFCAALCAFPTSCSKPPAVEVREITLKSSADAFLKALAERDYAQAESKFDAPMREALPADKLGALWERLVDAAGPFRQRMEVQVSKEKQDDRVYDVVLMKCEFERGAINTRVVFNGEGRITGLHFLPPAE